MVRKLAVIPLILLTLLGSPINCLADQTTRRDLAIGWQFSMPASGFCLKIPYRDDLYLQPIFSVAMDVKDTSTTGNYAFGCRGIYDLPRQQYYLPYVGVALGYSENFQTAPNSTYSEGNIGYETFFGVEYQKYLLCPALEVGIGCLNKYDKSVHAGITFNFSLLYYF